MNSYYLWTIGCQMNTADSERLGAALEQLGMEPVEKAADADVIVLNSCVVRQGAEDKVVSNLAWMAPLKKDQPQRILALMGCMVGPKSDDLARRFPYVDVFMRPQQFEPLLELVGERLGVDWEGCVGPLTPTRPDVSCHVPIIHGCDLMCTFCIIPYRRGRQVSRPVAEVALEVETLVARGVKEVTLLGQTVDAYGYDLPDQPNLADLFTRLNGIDGLERIRFLTSHPKFMTQEIIQAVADLPAYPVYIHRQREQSCNNRKHDKNQDQFDDGETLLAMLGQGRSPKTQTNKATSNSGRAKTEIAGSRFILLAPADWRLPDTKRKPLARGVFGFRCQTRLCVFRQVLWTASRRHVLVRNGRSDRV